MVCLTHFILHLFKDTFGQVGLKEYLPSEANQ